MEEQATLHYPLKDIVALCKRRGFIFPGSELYGGFANTYSYGPYGVEMKRIITNLWWRRFVHNREDMVGIDGPILLHPRAWEASGHVESFSDALVDCKECKSRYRADHLIEQTLKIDVEGYSLDQINSVLQEQQVICPNCSKKSWTAARHFNLMFSTQMSKTGGANGDGSTAFLRPETAQAIFLDYKNILDTMRVQLPFGIAQIGKAFRNEITPGNFTFRMVEFEQMEIEYFIHPNNWQKSFEDWMAEMWQWCLSIGLSEKMLSHYEHPVEKLSHYSKRTVDIMFNFPFGVSELYGLAYRTDYDLKRHAEFAKAKLDYQDNATKERFTPHVIEPTFGLDRTLLALLCSCYDEEELSNGEKRTVLRLPAHVAPVKAAIFPLMKKEPLVIEARKIFERLQPIWNVQYDDGGAIGKRYRRHDEIGTPICITIDYETLEDNKVTVRLRDTMEQKRVSIENLITTLATMLS